MGTTRPSDDNPAKMLQTRPGETLHPTPSTSIAASLPAIAVGIAVTICVYGYQFGRGNHGVYLLDALRRYDPSLLRNDWFLNNTLQYHILFSQLSAWLMKLGIIEPVFLTLYILLAIALHIAWLGIVRHLRGSDAAYLLSVAIYHLSAAGTGLGMYQFFQDSCLLPSNIANVALLWGIWLWLIHRPAWAGLCFGIAGVWHLNFAVVGSGLWLALLLWPPVRKPGRAVIIGTILALIPSALNVAWAMHAKLARSGAMPIEQFIDLYVKLRHPHHYEPASWPIGIWLAFGWTIVPALLLLRGQARRIVLCFLALLAVALLGAGVLYVSETLVQMSLYRFSIYIQLLGCVAAAIWLERRIYRRPRAMLIGGAVCSAIILTCILRGPFYGAFRMPRDDAGYLALCRWAASNTPADAIFLVPPDEESMRLIGRRAVIVNYKCVPQLSGELAQWQTRLSDLLGLQNLSELPRGYTRTLPAIRQRFSTRSADELEAVAARYDARYIVSTHRLEGSLSRLVYSDTDRNYFLYDRRAE